MVVSYMVIVEKADKQLVVTYKAAKDKGIRKPLERYGEVIDSELLVDIELLWVYFGLWGSLFFSKNT